MEQLRMRLPPRLQEVLAADVLAARDFNQTMRLDDAESLLFTIDATLGDGSGRLLEDAAMSFASRIVAEVSRRQPQADVKTLVTHLRAPLEHPFEGVTPRFELLDTETGFTLTVGVNGRPTTTRFLRHVTTGYIRAAGARLGQSTLRILGETVGNDRCVLSVHCIAEVEPVSVAPTSTRRSSPWRIATGGLTSEVERILGSAPTVPSFRSPLREGSQHDSDPGSGEQRPPESPPSLDEAAPLSSRPRSGR